jgi:hypothetical protein
MKNVIDIKNRNLVSAANITGVQRPGTPVTIYGLAIHAKGIVKRK